MLKRFVLTGDTFDHCLAEALTYTSEHQMNFADIIQ